MSHTSNNSADSFSSEMSYDFTYSPIGARFEANDGNRTKKRRNQCHQFSIGEKVWVRDEDDAEWEAGVVGAVTADGRPRVQRNSGTAAFPFNECRRRREGGRRPSSDSAFLKRLDSDSSDSSDSSSDSTESTSGRSDVSSLGGGAGGDLAAAGGGAATTEASPHRASMRRRNGEPDEPPPPVDRSPALSPTNRRKRDDER